MNKVSLGDLEYIDDVLKRHEEAMKYLAQSFGFTLEAEKRINEILKPEDEKPEPNKKCCGVMIKCLTCNGDFCEGCFELCPHCFPAPDKVEEKEKWKPGYLQRYYFIGENLEVSIHIWEGEYDEKMFKIGNCFKTLEEAQLALDKIRKLLS